jgi:hypothetical protein
MENSPSFIGTVKKIEQYVLIILVGFYVYISLGFATTWGKHGKIISISEMITWVLLPRDDAYDS